MRNFFPSRKVFYSILKNAFILLSVMHLSTYSIAAFPFHGILLLTQYNVLNSGKSIVSNFLAEATDNSSGEYKPTQGVRILEFESDTINVSGRIVKAEVELWDASGDTKFEACWPALMKDAHGIIFLYSSDHTSAEKEMDMWYANFVQAQGMKDSQCVVFCHQIPGSQGGSSSQLSNLFAHIPWIQTNVEEDGNIVRQEFNSFLQRLLSNINERREQEELSIMNQQ